MFDLKNVRLATALPRPLVSQGTLSGTNLSSTTCGGGGGEPV